MEKQGVINEANTPPEAVGEKEACGEGCCGKGCATPPPSPQPPLEDHIPGATLEEHLMKRAADVAANRCR